MPTTFSHSKFREFLEFQGCVQTLEFRPVSVSSWSDSRFGPGFIYSFSYRSVNMNPGQQYFSPFPAYPSSSSLSWSYLQFMLLLTLFSNFSFSRSGFSFVLLLLLLVFFLGGKSERKKLFQPHFFFRRGGRVDGE